jgi:hypothetical protein
MLSNGHLLVVWSGTLSHTAESLSAGEFPATVEVIRLSIIPCDLALLVVVHPEYQGCTGTYTALELF